MSDNQQLYTVESKTNKGTKYGVRHFDPTDKWICTCPSYSFGKIGQDCKHIIQVKKSLIK